MNATFRLACGALAALLLALAAPAQAQQPTDGGGPPDQQGQRPHGPPPEAIAACKGKAVGSVASFTGRDGRTVTGTCTQMGDVVAIAPPRPASGAAGGPPPQAR